MKYEVNLEKDKLYIAFHKPVGVSGGLISLWTIGKYSHAEFIYNDEVYLANPLCVHRKPFVYKDNMDIYELDSNIEWNRVYEKFSELEGKPYDWLAIFFSQFLFPLGIESKEKYFCSELCLCCIDYALDESLTYNLKDLKNAKGYHKFNPQRLYKYLKFMELLGRKVNVRK